MGSQNALVTTQPGNLGRSQSFTIADTCSFNPSTLNAFHSTVHRMRNDRGPSPKFITGKDLGVNMYVEPPDNLYLTVSNAFTVGCGICAPEDFNITTYSIADDVDVIRGGTMSSWDESRVQLSWCRKINFGLYVQDTFRLSSRLSLNRGLRWEPQIPPVDIRGVVSLFDQATFNAGQHSKVFVNGPAGELYYGDPGVPRRSRTARWLFSRPACISAACSAPMTAATPTTTACWPRSSTASAKASPCSRTTLSSEEGSRILT